MLRLFHIMQIPGVRYPRPGKEGLRSLSLRTLNFRAEKRAVHGFPDRGLDGIDIRIHRVAGAEDRAHRSPGRHRNRNAIGN